MIAPAKAAAQENTMMKSLILALSFAVLCAGLTPTVAEARRIGGGGSAGMQRSIPPRTPPAAAPTPPAQQATPAPAPAAPGMAPAAAPRRSGMGPLAGLAAGLGLAALASHFGMGAEFANLLMIVLLALLAWFAIRFVMSRYAHGPAPALATPTGSPSSGMPPTAATPAAGRAQPAALPGVAAPADAATIALPPGFDAAGFERLAKLIFIRMQAANDSADLNDLRSFTTPEMYAAIKLDLQDRGAAAQTTDVVRLDTELLEVATEGDRQIVSVRFHGLIREETDRAAQPFDEIWHVVRPADGSREWAIAGIQQTH
jgi:predicted lipid-binding transport protein (Tim44 family)